MVDHQHRPHANRARGNPSGAAQVTWGALAHRYLAGHFEVPVGGRQVALLGDAELVEAAVWEAKSGDLGDLHRHKAIDAETNRRGGARPAVTAPAMR